MIYANSAEAVAYTLFERLCYAERKDAGMPSSEGKGWERPDRSWILSTYAECLRTVQSAHAGAPAASYEAQERYAGWRDVPRESILASDPV